MARNKLQRFLLHNGQNLFYGLVFICDEALLFQTHDRREAIIHLPCELDRVHKALNEMKVQFVQSEVDEKQLILFMDMAP